MIKKIVILLIGLLILSSCQQSKKETFTKALSPSGAPALSLIPLVKENKESISIVNGVENLQAAFVSKDKEYSMIVAPINLGLNLINQKKTDYKLHSIITWGNLYLVKDSKNDVKKIALFGDKAVPGLIYNSLKEELGDSDYEEIWLPSVADAQKALLSGEVSVALLAEPIVTASIAKAKTLQKELIVEKDIQEVYATKNSVTNYPQAGLFVLDNVDVSNEVKMINEYLESLNSDSSLVIKDIEEVKAEYLGVPNGEIISKALSKMNVKLIKASEVTKEIEAFLKLFNLELTQDAIIK